MDENRKMIVQILSKGAQIAIPPSIHPATKAPYVANSELLDVIHNLPSLPRDLEKILRQAFNTAGIKVGSSGLTKVASFVPAGARDNAMVSHAGILARAVTRGERTLVEALSEMDHWVSSFTEKVAGDDISSEKAQAKVIEFLSRDVLGEKKTPLPMGWDDKLTAEDKEKLGVKFDEDHEIWDYDRIKSFLTENFAKYTDVAGPEWTTAMEVALSKTAQNRDLGQINEDRLLKFISEQSKNLIAVTSLRKRLAQLKKGEIEGSDHTEIAQMVIKDMSQFGEIRYHADAFWQWRGAHWQRVNYIEFTKHIAEQYGSLPAARRSSDHVGIVKVMGSLCSKDLQQVNIRGLNFANGYLTEDLQLMPHNPDFGCNYVLPYRYMPEIAGNFPQFTQFLSDVWGDDPDYSDKIDALQEAMAATMFGVGTRYQRCICLYGEGETGKSRLIEIVKGLLPAETCSTVPPQDWDDRFLPTRLYNKMLNECGELSESKFIAGETFKRIVEGSPMNGQNKNGPIFEFHPVATHWFATNHPPKTRDTSDGFTRRWLFFKFNKAISPEKKVIDIDKIIVAAEREAIAAWAAEGLKRLKANKGYTLPTSHMVIVDQVANDANSVRYFLQNSHDVKLKEGTTVNEAQLYHAYYAFCVSTQTARPVMQRAFHRLMHALQAKFHFEIEIDQDKGGRDLVVYHGITLEKLNASA